MWFLNQEPGIKDENPRSIPSRVPLLIRKSYTIGRQGASILLQGDQSISRKHATLEVFPDTAEKPGHLLLTDLSKFGTLVNGVRLAGKTPVMVKDGALITFGMAQNKFRVQKSIAVTTSNMPQNKKNQVVETIGKLGGRVLARWSEQCDFLVMTGITVTIKVIEALAACKPIVTPEFFSTIERCEANGQRCHDPLEFLPEVADESLPDKNKGAFAVDTSRRKLFADKTFVFLSDRMHADLKQVVLLAGGKCAVLSTPPADGNLGMLSVDGVCVMLPRTHEEWAVRVSSYLEEHDLRGIEHSELGFALVHNNVSSYTNPHASPPVHSQYSQANRTSQSLRSAPRPAPPLMSTQSLQQQPPANHDDDDIQISAVVPPSPAKKTVAPSSAAPAKIPSKAVARSHAAKDSLVVSTSPRPMLRRPAAGGDPATTSAVQDRQPATTEPKSTTSPTKPSAVSSHGTPTKTSDQELSPTKKSARTPLQFGKRSHSTVEDSPEEEPKSKRPRPASPVRAIRSRRTKDVPLEQSQLIEVKAEKSRNGADGTDDKADAKMLSSQMSLSSREDPSAPFSAEIKVEEDVPSNMMFVHTAGLLKPSSKGVGREQSFEGVDGAGGGVNFKRFKKVWPLSGGVVPIRRKMPRIIGGDALIVHTSNFRELDEFLMQEQVANAEMRRQDEFAAELFRKDSITTNTRQRR